MHFKQEVLIFVTRNFNAAFALLIQLVRRFIS